MKYQVDSQFIARLNTLVQEVLSDEARFALRNDQSLLTLHERIFSKNNQTDFQKFQPIEKQFFRRYFYSGSTQGNLRLDVPFADSPEDQAFFFDQFRQQVKNITYNFDRLDFLRPQFKDQKSTKPDFDSSQLLLISRAIIYPSISALEQREIAKLEQQKTNSTDTAVEHSSNPYQDLGSKVLVKGLSGEFDQVLTYNQLEQLSAQEEILRSQNLSPDQIAKSLRKYATETFRDLNLAINEQGKIETFLGGSGLSASGQPTDAQDSATFSATIKELKLRNGRQTQAAAVLASNGNLAFSTSDFQLKNANGVTTSVNGLTVVVDQAGRGNNAVFFQMDRQGVTGRFSIDTAALRNNEKPPINISIYQKPEEDSPANPKLKIGSQELDKFKKPLLTLFAQAQAPADYDPTAEKLNVYKPLTGKTNLPGTKTIDQENEAASLSHAQAPDDLSLTIPRPLAIGFQVSIKPKSKLTSDTTFQNNITTETRVMPKLNSSYSVEDSEEYEQPATQPTPSIPAANQQTSETQEQPPRPRQKSPLSKIAIALTASSLPTLAAAVLGFFASKGS